MMHVRASLFVAAIAAAPLIAQTPARAPVVAVTHHATRIGGEEIRYTAIVAETFLRDASGAPAASLVTTAYVREGVRDQPARPVMFLFNGGPGASSTPLHFGAFGPMRRADEAGGQTMVPNADSPLDVVDLVFIDPVGTGYSRPFNDSSGKRFWSRTGDALSVRMAIEQWLATNKRQQSPVYLCGESYGTIRAAMILRDPGSIRFNGVLLFALVAFGGDSDRTYVETLPTYAATAWFHERVPRNGRSAEQVYNEAVEFARSDYARALARDASLSAAERRDLAAKMSSVIGLPPEFIDERNLRISKEGFMFNLLKDRGVRTGQLDGRATVSFDAPKGQPPYDDPGMNYNPEAAANATSTLPQASTGKSAVDTYFQTALEFPTTERYNALNLAVNGSWNFEGWPDLNPEFGRAMQRDPRLRLFWAGGYFDITTPLFAARSALDAAGIPSGRLTAAAFAAGHSVFVEARSRAALSEAVRRFVTTN